MHKQTSDPRGSTVYYLCSTTAFITSHLFPFARARSRSCAFGYSSSSSSNNSSNGKNSLVPRTHIRLFFFFLVVMTKHIKKQARCSPFFFSPSLPSTQPVSKFSFASQTSSQEIKPFFFFVFLHSQRKTYSYLQNFNLIIY